MENTEEKKIGDVVALLSGGPWMTVQLLEEKPGDGLLCCWFNVGPHGYELKRSRFRVDTLRVVDTKEETRGYMFGVQVGWYTPGKSPIEVLGAEVAELKELRTETLSEDEKEKPQPIPEAEPFSA